LKGEVVYRRWVSPGNQMGRTQASMPDRRRSGNSPLKVGSGLG